MKAEKKIKLLNKPFKHSINNAFIRLMKRFEECQKKVYFLEKKKNKIDPYNCRLKFIFLYLVHCHNL